MMDLTDKHCRYPMEDSDVGLLFCGKEPLEKNSYCEKHHALCRIQKRKTEKELAGKAVES